MSNSTFCHAELLLEYLPYSYLVFLTPYSDFTDIWDLIAQTCVFNRFPDVNCIFV